MVGIVCIFTNPLYKHPLISALMFLALLANACNDQSAKEQILSENYGTHAKEALDFCRDKGLNMDFFILIDLRIHSGRKRFLVWDFNQREIVGRYLVSHGCCHFGWSGTQTKENAIVSNLDGSHCSSEGKYILKDRGPSSWGVKVKYLMIGQDATNNNALRRQIVFHSWEAVPDEEVYPYGTPEGWGCPAISNEAFRQVDELISQAEKPVLMWIIR